MIDPYADESAVQNTSIKMSLSLAACTRVGATSDHFPERDVTGTGVQ